MSDDNSRSDRDQRRMPSKDIMPVLKGWDYESGTINVRKIVGHDGTPKLQMRQPLGLIQMEMTGRPDGAKPHGYDSLLDFYEHKLKDYRQHRGTEEGFELTAEQCEDLREEAAMYYSRYLSLFVLEEFGGVVRDTARNLRVLDFCSRYAADQEDRLILEQYRPYITMMHTRARASLQQKDKKFNDALETINAGIASIRDFYARFGQEEAAGESNEIKVLRKFASEIRRRIPIDPLTKLRSALDRALQSERYEDAARLRDQIRAISGAPGEGPTAQPRPV